jgi:NNP family nitrate/nitrite transporter-like MFS transporter
VPQYFPRETGTVTGLVGAMGGLGGFFPPLVLGAIKSSTGHYDLGFVLLSVFCAACFALNAALLLRRTPALSAEPALAGAPAGH